MHHITLNRAGADDRNLNDEIVEFFRLEARQHVDLCPAFHLKHADGIALGQHVIGGFIVLRHIGEGKV